MAKRSEVLKRKDGAIKGGVIGTASKSPSETAVLPKNEVLIKTDEKNPPLVSLKTAIGLGIVHNHVYVNTNVTPIVGENPKRNSVFIRNLSQEIVWVGESGVRAGLDGNGFPIKEDEILMLDRSYGPIFGVTEANTAVLAVMEE